MTIFAKVFSEIWRDYNTAGVASSGAKAVVKSDMRTWGAAVEQALDSIMSGGSLIYDTVTTLNADLAHGANSQAWVIADSTAANNGVYRKSGASGAGSWSRVADLPYAIIPLTVTGGTANAITATSALPVPTGDNKAIFLLTPSAANTSGVTIAINGAAAVTLLTQNGAALGADYLAANAITAFVKVGSYYRTLNDLGNVQAAAASASSAAASAASAAASASASGSVVIYDTKSAATSALGGLSENQIVEVLVDESRGSARTRYRVTSGALVFKVSLSELTGPVSLTPGSSNGNLLESDPSAQDATASKLTLTYKKGSVVSGLTNPNNKWCFGYNMAPNGLRDDTGDIAMFLGFDTNYGAGGGLGATAQLSLGCITSDGYDYQLYSMEFPYSHAASRTLFQGRMQFNSMVLQDRGDVPYLTLDWGAGVSTPTMFLQNGLLMEVQTNNIAAMSQKNAAGSATISLPYINSQDDLHVSSPIYQYTNGISLNGALAEFSSFANLANDKIGIYVSSPVATGANINAAKFYLNTTGTVDHTVWNLGGGNAYMSAWVDPSGGDAASYYNVNGGGKWTAGLDNSDSDAFVIAKGGSLGTDNVLRADPTSLQVAFPAAPKVPSSTVAGLPSASTYAAGSLIFVSNESGGATLAFSDGTNWRRVTDRAVVS